MLEKMGGRKLAVSILALATGLGVALGMGDIPDNLLQLLEVIVASFVSGNIAAQIFGAVKPIGGIKKPDDEGSAPAAADQPINYIAPQPTPMPVMAEGIPVSVAVDAFKELGVLIGSHADRQSKQMEELMKATQINQQALSVVVEKVMSR